jgi:Tfx family DNA-binding protein
LLTEKEIEVLRLRKANLTQVEVAKKLGVSQAAVSSFEKNALKKIREAGSTVKLMGSLAAKGGKNGKS